LVRVLSKLMVLSPLDLYQFGFPHVGCPEAYEI
jgi:hypothetical protein